MTIDWIAADWGTTNLRLWAMSGRTVVEARDSDQGMGGLTPDRFAGVLAQATQGWPAVPVIACGMVGSRQGWVEAPYAPVPCPAAPRMVAVSGDPGGRPVRVICGVRQDDPADVMRGEEPRSRAFWRWTGVRRDRLPAGHAYEMGPHLGR